MRKITIWISATLAVVALVFAYQWNLSGGGKGESRNSDTPPATCSTTTSASGGAAPCPTSTGSGGDKADDGRGTNSSTGKPGESK